jgi:hypothetical protein
MTNKEIAERLRELAQAMRVAEIPMPHVIEEVADTLDSPKPKPGTLVWWREVFFGASKKWQLGEATWEGIHGLGSEGLMTWGDVEYKPARILSDDEVAGIPGELIRHNGKTYKILEIPPMWEWPIGANEMAFVYFSDERKELDPDKEPVYTITRAEAEESQV